MNSTNRFAVINAQLTANKSGGPYVFALQDDQWVELDTGASVNSGMVVVSDLSTAQPTRIPAAPQNISAVRATQGGEDPWPVPPPPPPPMSGMGPKQVFEYINNHGPWSSTTKY